jgi:hypothetical protein
MAIPDQFGERIQSSASRGKLNAHALKENPSCPREKFAKTNHALMATWWLHEKSPLLKK